ncbi:MAG TPA: hypothetical protein VLI69_08035 [Gammaproteobacteria bacterium]|nr:hypothetical protein [Gammaproteobacteria bacterium]
MAYAPLPKMLGAPRYEEGNILFNAPALKDMQETNPAFKKQLLEQQEAFQKSIQKKIDDAQFFDGLDVKAYLENQKLVALREARKEEVLRAFELDALKFRELLREQQAYLVQAQNHSTPEVVELVQKASSIDHTLQETLAKFRALQYKVNNWEKDEWEPALKTAAEDTAEVIIEHSRDGLAQNPDYLVLQNALVQSHPDQDALAKELAAEEKETQEVIAAQLKARSTPSSTYSGAENRLDSLLAQIIAVGQLSALHQRRKDRFMKAGINKTNPEAYNQFNPMSIAIGSVNDGKCQQRVAKNYSDVLDIVREAGASDCITLQQLRVKAIQQTNKSATALSQAQSAMPNQTANPHMKNIVPF